MIELFFAMANKTIIEYTFLVHSALPSRLIKVNQLIRFHRPVQMTILMAKVGEAGRECRRREGRPTPHDYIAFDPTGSWVHSVIFTNPS
jgi:hypothetical protein